MLVEVTGLLLVAGGLTWLLGHLFQYVEIAFIGAVTIIGVGAQTTLNGIQTASGEVIVENSTTNETVVETTYEAVPLLDSFPVGMLFMLIGAALMYRTLAKTHY